MGSIGFMDDDVRLSNIWLIYSYYMRYMVDVCLVIVNDFHLLDVWLVSICKSHTISQNWLTAKPTAG